MLIIADRYLGLFIYEIEILLEGYSLRSLTAERVYEHLSMDEIYRFNFRHNKHYLGQIREIETRSMSYGSEVLVRTYERDRMCLLNLANPLDPYVVRIYDCFSQS